MSWYTWAWIFWLAFFLLVEGKALFNKQPGDTFFEFVWRLFRVEDSRPTWAGGTARSALATYDERINPHDHDRRSRGHAAGSSDPLHVVPRHDAP
jgi:hypothetical protein